MSKLEIFCIYFSTFLITLAIFVSAVGVAVLEFSERKGKVKGDF